MSDLAVVVAMGLITYGSRAIFLASPGSPPSGIGRRFLDRFPLALFVALAASILVLPSSDVDAVDGWVAVVGAVVGGWMTRRSLYGVVGVGFAAYWTARVVLG